METKRYSISLVTQGKNRFYTLTMPSDILGKTCFVSSRDEDPKEGFQRLLNVKRADEIANYIDKGHGTIPTAIVLSAQKEADMKIIGGKSIEFKEHPKAFLILDGQHRVWGFAKAKTALRVPVVIYDGLSRRDESRIFIDINTQQKPVPNELLLDIKSLAEYETDTEVYLSNIFDMFDSDARSALLGLTSKAKRSKKKISRVTFNSAFKPILRFFGAKEPEEIYNISNMFLSAFLSGLRQKEIDYISITSSTLFKAIIALFPVAARRGKEKYGKYSITVFEEVLAPLFSNIKKSKFSSPGNSYKELVDYFEDCLNSGFTI